MKAKVLTTTDADAREELFIQVTRDLWLTKDLQSVAIEAGVTVKTLYNWVNCVVFAPRINTLFPVARALGYRIEIVRPKRKAGRPPLRRIK